MSKTVTWLLPPIAPKDKEELAILNYLRSQKHTSRIIEVYGDYIILANDDADLRFKKARIDRGDGIGFYIKQRILDIINSNEINDH